MHISQDNLKSVVFLCLERKREETQEMIIAPEATAFLVRVADDSHSGLDWTYVVTSRHFIEDATEDKIYLRVNTTEGSYEEFPSNRDHWSTHDSEDVAAIPPQELAEKASNLDYSSISSEALIGPDFRGPSGNGVNIGDEVYFIGLFVQAAGRGRNLPIARFGNISRMPQERIALRRGGAGSFEALAYLAECRSWGGHSGSPVYWTYSRPGGGALYNAPSGIEAGKVTRLLGLVSAHFDIPTEARTTGDILGKIETGVNAGIAVITPAEAIRELLMDDNFAEDRQRRRERLQSKQAR